MHREHHQWSSERLGRQLELVWYGNWGRPVLMFPTSHGSVTQNEDFGLIGALQPKIDSEEIQICCIDTPDQDSWQNDGIPPQEKVRRHDLYDRFLVEEILPFLRHKAEREDVVAYGASFGAYHAVNLALRHPEAISRVIAFSGVFDIHSFLGGYWDDTCYFHCPTAYVPNWDDEWVQKARAVEIVLATGEQDHIVQNTREFADVLRARDVPVREEIWQGVFGHDWPFWREHLPRFLP